MTGFSMTGFSITGYRVCAFVHLYSLYLEQG
mgnify:CR=1 FL=1